MDVPALESALAAVMPPGPPGGSMKQRNAISVLASVMLASAWCTAQAQSTTTIYEEYRKLVQRGSSLSAVGDDLFGDHVNLYSGSVEFVQTDVSLPGNDGLAVSVGRRFVPNQNSSSPAGHFADWDLDVPHMHGVFANTRLWAVAYSGADAYKRCSKFAAPPDMPAQNSGYSGVFTSNEYWHGHFLYLPGTGSQEILRRAAATPVPSDGRSYPLVTKSGAVVSCLSSLAPTSGGQGEGFEVLTTDGIRYRFDQLASRSVSSLTKSNAAPGMVGAMVFDGYLLRRQEVWIMPTLATDRFGNTVTYNWNSIDPWLLDSIVASDGRTLTLTYGGGNRPRIETVSDGTYNWRYVYQESRLWQVLLPDNTSSWSFDLEPIRYMYQYTEGGGCADPGAPMYGPRTGSMTHPGGASGSFTIAPVKQGRSWVPLSCLNHMPPENLADTGQSQFPAEYIVPALTAKKLSGPGLPSAGLSWNYTYGPENNCYSPGSSWASRVPARVCEPTSPTSRTINVTGPDGKIARYTFGNRFQSNEGQLLIRDDDWNGSGASRSTAYVYAGPGDGPYPNPIGSSPQTRSDSYLGLRHTPVRQTTIRQDERTFKWDVAAGCGGSPYCFDGHARPTKVTKSSSPSP